MKKPLLLLFSLPSPVRSFMFSDWFCFLIAARRLATSNTQPPFCRFHPFQTPTFKTNDPHRQTRHGMSTPIYKSTAKKFPAVGICKTRHAARAKTGGVFGRNQRLLEGPEQRGTLATIQLVTSGKTAPNEEYLVACGSPCDQRANCIILSQPVACCMHAAIGA
jgi:hypothetical protein